MKNLVYYLCSVNVHNQPLKQNERKVKMLKSKCIEEVIRITDEINVIWPGIDLYVEVEWFYKSRTAGYAYVYKNKVGFNVKIMEATSDEKFIDIIKHELAHKVVHKLYPNAKQAHGPEFKHVNRKLGGMSNIRHNLDVSVSGNKMTLFHYKCFVCEKELRISKTMHNKVQRGEIRTCTCKKGTITTINYMNKSSIK